jgi:AraC family transcriptional regulator of adaptative response / DNA-3-methyladenine glycosylase II
MDWDTDSCYRVIEARDARFDGKLFVGVSTTGIYCRPVCRARTPMKSRCSFYRTPAAAEIAGFRPCLRCRPELAPGSARVDAASRLASLAFSRIEDGALTDMSLAALASELGVSDRHLRRVVESEFGVTPVELAQTQRLLLAKRLLTDTSLSISEIAFASGFNSLTRFNALFKQRYRLNPTALRREGASRRQDAPLVCELPFREPFDWNAHLRFLAQRAVPGIEHVDAASYARTFAFGKSLGWIRASVSDMRPALLVEVSSTLAPHLPPVLGRIKRLFDLNADPASIAAALGPVAAPYPGLRLPGAMSGYEIAVRAILGQQVSVAAARTLAGRVVAQFGTPIITPIPQLTHAMPTPLVLANVAPATLAELGIVGSRSRAIVALSQAVVAGLALDAPGDSTERLASLRQIPGIGEWTVQYIAMRALGGTDAFPHTDLALLRALGTKDPKRALEIAEQWRPWRAYAAIALWKSLETEK